MQFLIPFIAHADGPLSIKQLMFRISYYLINPLIVFGFVVALIYFIWGVIDFLRSRESGATDKAEGKSHLWYGIVGMVIMVSAFAIMRLIADAIGAGQNITSHLP